MKIQKSTTGQFLKTITGYKAFVPHPLPPALVWNNAVVNALSRADYLLGKLAHEGGKLPNPHLLMRPFLTREAVLSSKIEGTQATIGEILVADVAEEARPPAGDLQEVRNYIKALDHGIKCLKTLPLSLRLIRELHLILMQGARGGHATPGEFRRSQNWIGAPGCTLNTAKFVPSSPQHFLECLGQLEHFLQDRTFPRLVHIALCHYQLEAIHPFLDGNGRVGRLLIILLFMAQKMLPGPLLYLSAFFEATREVYYQELYAVSAQGTWQAWLTYFLNGVAVQSEDALSRAARINAFLSQWKMKVAGSNSTVPVAMVQRLAVNPYLTTKKIAAHLDVAYSTAQRGVQKLVLAGIIAQVSGQKRDRVYCAQAILDILEEPAKITPDFEE